MAQQRIRVEYRELGLPMNYMATLGMPAQDAVKNAEEWGKQEVSKRIGINQGKLVAYPSYPTGSTSVEEWVQLGKPSVIVVGATDKGLLYQRDRFKQLAENKIQELQVFQDMANLKGLPEKSKGPNDNQKALVEANHKLQKKMDRMEQKLKQEFQEANEKLKQEFQEAKDTLQQANEKLRQELQKAQERTKELVTEINRVSTEFFHVPQCIVLVNARDKAAKMAGYDPSTLDWPGFFTTKSKELKDAGVPVGVVEFLKNKGDLMTELNHYAHEADRVDLAAAVLATKNNLEGWLHLSEFACEMPADKVVFSVE